MFEYDLKNLNSEGDVESKYIQELFTKVLGFDLNKDLKWKESVKFKQGRKWVTKQADLIVYKNNKPVIVVEAKNPSVSCNDNIEQTDSYSFAKEVRYSLTINGRQLILREYLAGNKKQNIVNTEIKKLHKEGYKSLINAISKENINSDINSLIDIKQEDEIIEIKDYRRFFRSIHNIIRDNEKLDPIAAFDEFSKVLYLKMASEQYKIEGNETDVFDIERFKGIPGQDPMELINLWFEKTVNRFYKNIFETAPKFLIKLNTLESVLKKLDEAGFKFKDKNMDIKGKAFEEFLPTQLRGKGLGQFFTPRTIVNFMVDMAKIDLSDIILDFACGSGGFLIKSYEKMLNQLNTLPETTFTSIGTTKDDFIKNLKENQLNGIDAEPKAVRIAKMNMMLWGDGNQIVRGNGLDYIDHKGNEYSIKNYDEEKEEGGCTLILANPPFGSNEKDENILSEYSISESSKSVPTQKLFIERGIKLLKPSGRMIIVLPEGILSNEQDMKIREFIIKNAKVKAIIELPKHTFVQSGVDTINTVVLYLEKYETKLKEKVESLTRNLEDSKEVFEAILKSDIDELKYKIFMASVQNVGFEPNGRVFVKSEEKTDLDIILEVYKDGKEEDYKFKDLIEEDIEEMKFEKKYNWKKSNYDYMYVDFFKLEKRFDPSYYLFWKNIKGLKGFSNFVPLSKFGIIQYKDKLEKPKTDEELDKEYKLYSVDKNEINGMIRLDDYITGNDISFEKQKKLIIESNCILFNPYRANIGSFALSPNDINVNLDKDGNKIIDSVTSGAYVQFTVKEFNIKLLLQLLKTPLYSRYINILSSGSVRDNFKYENLKDLLVPNLKRDDQEILLKKILENKNKSIDLINKKIEIEKEIVKKVYKGSEIM